MKLGNVVVTCPGCGGAFEVKVALLSATYEYGSRVRFTFGDELVEHVCEGRA